MIRRLLPLLMLCLPPTVESGVYRCEDAQGNVSFHETQPIGKDCSGARPPPPPSSDAGTSPLVDYTRKLEEQRSEAAKTAEESARAEATKADNCRKVRERLAYLQDSGGRVYKTDESGDRSYLTDPQYQKELSDARAQVTQHCG